MKPILNIDDVEMRDFGNGQGFDARIGSFGEKIGSTGMGVMLHEVEPGKKAFPFHNHHKIEELFVILEGEGTYRFGEERFPIKSGDVCAAPTGWSERAHQIINTGINQLKYLGNSTKTDTEVVEYPDSNKFVVMSRFDWSNPKAGGIRHMTRSENSLDYFDGEE
ncbi:MAG: cupin domain-containing protein [Rhizobiaceae bacterium]